MIPAPTKLAGLGSTSSSSADPKPIIYERNSEDLDVGTAGHQQQVYPSTATTN